MNYKEKIEKLGYVVSGGERDNFTRICEPFTSSVTGKVEYITVAFSSKKNDESFLMDVYKSLLK